MIIFMQQTIELIQREHPKLVDLLQGKLEMVKNGELIYFKLIEVND